MAKQNRYEKIIEKIFFRHYRKGKTEVTFSREEIEHVAQELGIERVKNFGDLIYSFRYRNKLPEAIQACAPEGLTWIIRSDGRSRYKFVATKPIEIVPNGLLVEIKIPDATPGVISMYALTDEQALLAKLRYNRLIDIFTGVTCYSLQSHLRSTVPELGQVETDEIYVGVDKRGAHYVFPVQAKGHNDNIGIVQIEQDIALCAKKFPTLLCYPIATQFMAPDLIALFLFESTDEEPKLMAEKHYRLAPPGSISVEDLQRYQRGMID